MRLNEIFPEHFTGPDTYDIDKYTFQIFVQHKLPEVLKQDFEEGEFVDKVIEALITLSTNLPS